MYVMAQEGTIEYQATPKGRGFVYVTRISCTSESETEGRTKYLKCCKLRCDGSAKIVGDLLSLGVCIFMFY